LAELSSFGEWLKRQRKAEGWTQEQLALQINCSTSELRKIEAEERHPSAQIVGRLAEIFQIPQDERSQFVLFARGDWQAAPAEVIEEAPWRGLHIADQFSSRRASQLSALPTGTVTFLYTDIEGSTQLWKQDPQSMAVAHAMTRFCKRRLSPTMDMYFKWLAMPSARHFITLQMPCVLR